ncbi:MAG: alkaline phosphatase family protein [Verrucomicrobia bacterium]|nr:alkaline phosphatase family protein [Verrucomicrobiota bacterium]
MTAFLRRFAISLLVFTAAFTALAERRAEHVFIISIDGGKPAVIQQSAMPVLKKLVAEGAHTWTAQTIYPSKTLPSHTSMLTGVGPDKHMISWNNWLPTNGLVSVPTVFSEAKHAGLSTGMFVGKEKFRHLALPGTLDIFDYNKAASGVGVDKTMAGQALATKEGTVLAKTVAADVAPFIKEKKPNLCMIHFTDTDNTGHKSGWGSTNQMQAFADTDAALGVVVKAIQDAGIADTSVILISADHGGHDKTHGFNTPDDMTIPWIAWGKGVKKGFAIDAPVTTYDMAATALWLLDVKRPESFDGQPVATAFE